MSTQKNSQLLLIFTTTKEASKRKKEESLENIFCNTTEHVRVNVQQSVLYNYDNVFYCNLIFSIFNRKVIPYIDLL